MYEDYFGFSERPFQLTPDPAFYFESVTHKKALSYLGYGLNQGEGFIVITGEVGAGKSTLVGHLKGKLDRRRMSVGEVVTSALDDSEMIAVAARSFGLDVPGGDKAAALAAIELFLHEEARSGRKVLLIVDEAQNLSIGALEELRMLSNFQLGSHPLLQTLLLGQPEFRQLVARSEELEQLRQRIIASHHLEPMQPGEIEPYVMHRLKRVGWDGRPQLANGLWVKLHKATGGIPRKLNQLMTRLFMAAAIEQKDAIGPTMLDAVLADMNGPGSLAGAEDEAPRPVLDRDMPAPEAFARARREAQAPAAAPLADAPAAPLKGKRAEALERQLAALEKAFSRQEDQLAQLRTELALVSQVQDAATGTGEPPAEIAAQLDRLEARIDEQEQSLRHVLTMMIDYFEQAAARAAA